MLKICIIEPVLWCNVTHYVKLLSTCVLLSVYIALFFGALPRWLRASHSLWGSRSLPAHYLNVRHEDHVVNQNTCLQLVVWDVFFWSVTTCSAVACECIDNLMISRNLKTLNCLWTPHLICECQNKTAIEILLRISLKNATCIRKDDNLKVAPRIHRLCAPTNVTYS